MKLLKLTRFWSLWILLLITLAPIHPLHAKNTDSLRQRIEYGRGNVFSLAWRPDAKVLAVGSGLGVTLLDSTFRNLGNLDNTKGDVWQLVWNRDGTRLATNVDEQTVCFTRIWDIDTTGRFWELSWSAPFCAYSELEWSANGQWLSFTDEEKRLYVADTRRTGKLRLIDGQTSDTDWHPSDNRLAIADEDQKIRILDVGMSEFTLEIPEAGDAVAWSPAGDEILTVAQIGKKLIPISAEFGETLWEWPAYHAMRTWDASSGEVMQEVNIEPTMILETVYWLPNNLIGGDCYYRAGDTTFPSDNVCLWDLLTGEEEYYFYIAGGSSWGGNLKWSPDYSKFNINLYWHGTSTKIFDVGKESHWGNAGFNGSWTPDSRYLTTIDYLGTLHHFDTWTQTETEYPLFEAPSYDLVRLDPVG